MSEPTSPDDTETGDDRLSGRLGLAVDEIRTAAPPHDALQSTLARAAERAAAEQGRGAADDVRTQQGGSPHRSQTTRAKHSPRFALGVAASLAVVAMVAAVVGYLLMTPKSEVKIAQGNVGVAPSDRVHSEALVSGAAARDGVALSDGLGVSPRDGRSRFAGASPSRWMSVAADATVLVSTGGADSIELGSRQRWNEENTLHLWDWSKSTVSRPLDAIAERSMTVAPDGSKVVTIDGRVIDMTTSEIGRLDNFDGDVNRVKFSGDGRLIVLMVHGGGNQGTARLLEFPSGKKVCEIPDIFPHMFVAAFDRDAKQIVLIGTDLRTRRFDANSGMELAKYEPPHSNSVRAVAISNDGKYVVSSGPNNETYLWDAESTKLLHKLDVEQQPNVINEVYSFEFSHDDKLLSGGGAQNLLLWNTASGAVERIYPTSSGGAVHIRFDKESKEMTTVHEFHGAEGENGEDLLVYPRLQKWRVEVD